MEGEMYQFDKEKQMLEFPECAGQPEQMSQGETKVRRKRRKVKGEERAGGPKKRKLSNEQVTFLELSFGYEHKLEAARKDRLATELGLEPRQVAVWFQNRRVRWKCKQMEEEYVKLKKTHELVLLQKCQLENQVVKLRERLSEVEREMGKLSERHDEATSEGGKSGSPSFPHSTGGATHPPLVDCGDKLFYTPECTYYYYYYLNGMDEWADLYMP